MTRDRKPPHERGTRTVYPRPDYRLPEDAQRQIADALKDILREPEVPERKLRCAMDGPHCSPATPCGGNCLPLPPAAPRPSLPPKENFR